MNRQIIFRGKRLDNGEWVCGSFVANECAIINHDNDRTVWCVAPETVSQFTGMVDIDGKEIFEGDLLQLVEPRFPEIDGTMYEVQWCDRIGGYEDTTRTGFLFDNICPERQGRVVGNRFDNPELSPVK